MYLVGVDPGLAKIGLALVHHDGEKRLLSVDLVETVKAKGTAKMAVSADYNMRYYEVFQAVREFVAEVPSNERVLIGIEGLGYTPGAGRSLLNTAQAVGVIKSCFFAMNKLPFEFKPTEVKQTILGKKSGTKQEVQDELERRFPNLSELLAPYAKGKHEHLADAVALAECAFEEYAQRKLYLGVMEA